MEELREKANSYAEENVNNVLKEAFAKVYADGYRDGYKDCEDEISVDLRDNKTEYVDLGLPSGILWAKDYEKEGEEIAYYTYDEAQHLCLPRQKDCAELIDTCSWHPIFEDSPAGPLIKKVICVGPNGNKIEFTIKGRITNQIEPSYIYMWIKSAENQHKITLKQAMHIHNYDGLKRSNTKVLRKIVTWEFMGYKLPVRQVKEK